MTTLKTAAKETTLTFVLKYPDIICAKPSNLKQVLFINLICIINDLNMEYVCIKACLLYCQQPCAHDSPCHAMWFLEHFRCFSDRCDR